MEEYNGSNFNIIKINKAEQNRNSRNLKGNLVSTERNLVNSKNISVSQSISTNMSEEKNYVLSNSSNDNILYGNNITCKYPSTMGLTRTFLYINKYPILSIGPKIFISLLILFSLIFVYIYIWILFYEKAGKVFKIIFHLSFYGYFINHILAVLINPGIPSIQYNTTNKNDLRDAKVNKLNYTTCKKCGLTYKVKDRISHCYDCKICYFNRYQHSKLIGHCIGKYNSIFYYFFVMLLFFFLLICFSMILVRILQCFLQSEMKNND